MAKYSKKYSENRKLNPNKKKLDGLERGPDGNYIIRNESDPFGGYSGNNAGTQDSGIYSNPNSGQSQGYQGPSAGQYGQYAAITAGTANNINQISKDPNMGEYGKNDAYVNAASQGVTQGIGTINPIIGAATGIRKSATAAVGDKQGANRTISNWMAGPHEALGNDISSFKSAEDGTQKAGSIFSAIGDITGASKMRQMFSYGTGNDEKTTGAWGLYNDLSGITSRNNKKQNIYDETHPAVTTPFVPREKTMEDTVEQELKGFTQYEMGGNLTQYQGNSHEQGGIPIGQKNEVETGETRGPKNSPTTKDYIYSDTLKVGKKTYADLSKAIEKKYSRRENDRMSAEQKELELSNLMNSQEEHRERMMMNTYKKAYVGPMNGRSKYRWGGNGEWIPDEPTGPRAAFDDGDSNFGADNTELINATNDLGAASYRNQNLAMTAETAREASGYNPNRQYTPSYNPYQNSLKPWSLNKSGDLPDYKGADMNDATTSQNPAQTRSPRGANNFDYNSLYAAGNFLGSTYDVYRGLKGGDPVDYERITAQTVNPELVNYKASRDLERRDVKEGFNNTQRELKNVNNPAQYLSLITQTAGNRDKTISDAIAKSYENEINTNAQLKNQAKYYNAGAKTNADVFNAQTQRAELDARQMEKDISKNTLSTGLYNTGMALSQMGSDANFTKQDKLAMDAIGQKYPNWKYDSKTNKWKYKNQTKTTADLIG